MTKFQIITNEGFDSDSVVDRNLYSAFVVLAIVVPASVESGI